MRFDASKHHDPLQGHLFWSRPGGRDMSAEVDCDRPCSVCGYNLRGRAIKSRCPECGSLCGWTLHNEPVAWDDAQTPRAFVSTCLVAIFQPHLLARHVWLPHAMDLAAARRFRRLCLMIAGITFSMVALGITLRTTDLHTAALSLPFQVMAIVVWLNAVTLEPLSRFKDSAGNNAIGRRVQAIVHYASAALMLSPLHLVLLYFELGSHLSPDFSAPWLVLAAIHVVLLIVQLCLSATALGWLQFELVDMPKLQAHTLAITPVLTAAASAGVILIGFPSVVSLLMWHALGN